MYPKLTKRGDVLEMLDEMIAFRQKIIDPCSKLTVGNSTILSIPAPGAC